MLRIMMLLVKARNDVMFAHYAVRHNIIHEVNITAVGNIICPQGQTSFSVNAPLRASRYFVLPFLLSSRIRPITEVRLFLHEEGRAWTVQSATLVKKEYFLQNGCNLFIFML